jgi:hypothetical protein
MTEGNARFEFLQEVVDSHANDKDRSPHVDYWLTLMVILTDEELIRFIKRCSMKPLLETALGYRLGTALESEMIKRDLLVRARKLPKPDLPFPQ